MSANSWPVGRGPWAVDTRGPCCTPTKLILCTSALLASSYGQLPPSRANRLQTRRLQPAELRRQWQWPIGTQTCWGSYPSASRGERPAPASGSSTRLLSVCLQAEQRGAHAVVFRDACGAAPSLPAPTRCQTMECCANSSGGRLTRLGLWRRAVRDWDRASFIMPEMLRCNPTKPQSAQHRAQNQNTEHRGRNIPIVVHPLRGKPPHRGLGKITRARAGPSMRLGCSKHAVCRQDGCTLRMYCSNPLGRSSR